MALPGGPGRALGIHYDISVPAHDNGIQHVCNTKEVLQFIKYSDAWRQDVPICSYSTSTSNLPPYQELVPVCHFLWACSLQWLEKNGASS